MSNREIRTLTIPLCRESIHKQILNSQHRIGNKGVEKLEIKFGEDTVVFKSAWIKKVGHNGDCVIEYIDD